MSVLSMQSIRRLCRADPPLITPWVERGVQNGKSYGLSACTYDCRIAEDVSLAPMPSWALVTMLVSDDPDAREWARRMVREASGKPRALVSTIERFSIPANVCATPLDKSTYARVFVSAFNTHFDPGFRGHATIELVNLGDGWVHYQVGDPVCQFKFEWLDESTEQPYEGKYQDQQSGPQPARYLG